MPYLSGLSRKVVGRLLGAGDAGVEVRITPIVGGEDGVLETAGIQEVKIELAVLTALGDGRLAADGSHVAVHEDRQGCLVGADGVGDSALRATRAGVGEAGDLNSAGGRGAVAKGYRAVARLQVTALGGVLLSGALRLLLQSRLGVRLGTRFPAPVGLKGWIRESERTCKHDIGRGWLWRRLWLTIRSRGTTVWEGNTKDSGGQGKD